jgi:spore maturation protein CgeB
MKPTLTIAFYGSSLVSAYWNGAATYYRGILKALAALGHKITFYEPDAFERQQHRDIEDPEYARIVVYQPTEDDMKRVVREGMKDADVVVKASGVGVLDTELEEAVVTEAQEDTTVVFWDVDAPATLTSMETDKENSLRRLLPRFDMILTYGGGDKVVDRYRLLGAPNCTPIYNALDPDTHFPVEKTGRFHCDLAFLGNRLPDREERVEEFFLKPAALRPKYSFILGGSGWQDKPLPSNVRYIGHVYTHDHNALNSSAKTILNINRASMASNGFSPATRIFEAAGAGACILTDDWEGIETFFDPSSEILPVDSGETVAAMLDALSPKKARDIGKAAYRKVLQAHTYSMRARQAEALFINHRARHQQVNSGP